MALEHITAKMNYRCVGLDTSTEGRTPKAGATIAAAGASAKKGKKEDAETKATRPAGKKFGMTALEEFARAEAKGIPALAEAIARRGNAARC